MNREKLYNLIKLKRSFLCVGLDTDMARIPEHLKKSDDPVFEFNRAIIDSTFEYAVAYKFNLAFYEHYGSKGWLSLERTMGYLKSIGNIFTIADAKRGDIGNSASQYARAFFDHMGFDAVTVNPYMGRDAVEPFLRYDDKFTVILALTSNQGSSDFQMQKCGNKYLYEEVITRTSEWGSPDQIIYVIGATKPDVFAKVRGFAPGNFLLVPGIGLQGGDLNSVCRDGLNEMCGLIVNASRSIIYASTGQDFDAKACKAASELQRQMETILNNRKL